MLRPALLFIFSGLFSLHHSVSADYTYVFPSRELLPIPTNGNNEAVITGILKTATGREHTLILKTNGTVWAAGSNELGQLGTAGIGLQVYFKPIALGAIDIAAGDSFSYWVKPDLTLWTVGTNLHNTGEGFRVNPTIVDTNVRAIYAGDSHALILKTDFSLWAIGGGFGTEIGQDQIFPEKIADNVITAAAGTFHSFYIRSDNTLWAIGFDSNSKRVVANSVQTGLARLIANNAKAIAAGANHSILLKTDDTLWGEGINASGELGIGDQSPRLDYVPISTSVNRIAAKGSTSAFIDSNGRLKTMGTDLFSETESPARSTPTVVDENAFFISLGGDFAAYIKGNQLQYQAAGKNDSGQLGLQSPPSLDYPLVLADNIKTIESGYAHILMIDDQDRLWAAGENFYGAIGDGTLKNAITPVQVATGVTHVSAGSYHSLFLKNDNSLWGMGQGGKLGDGSMTDRLSPIEIAQGIISFAAGNGRSFFIKSDHSLWAMGSNGEGSLGDGTKQHQLTPVRILDAADSVDSSGHYTLIRKTDGSLWSIGRIGQAYNIPIHDPFIKVADDITRFAIGEKHLLFLKPDGELWGQGANDYGQIGLGWGHSSKQVLIAKDVIEIDAADNRSLFLTSDRNLWVYGRNSSSLPNSVPDINRSLTHVAAGVQSFSAGSRRTLITSSALQSSDVDQDGHLALFDPNDLNPYNPLTDANRDFVPDNFPNEYPEGDYSPSASQLISGVNGPKASFVLSPGYEYFFEASEDLKTWTRVPESEFPSIKVNEPTRDHEIDLPNKKFLRLKATLD